MKQMIFKAMTITGTVSPMLVSWIFPTKISHRGALRLQICTSLPKQSRAGQGQGNHSSAIMKQGLSEGQLPDS